MTGATQLGKRKTFPVPLRKVLYAVVGSSPRPVISFAQIFLTSRSAEAETSYLCTETLRCTEHGERGCLYFGVLER